MILFYLGPKQTDYMIVDKSQQFNIIYTTYRKTTKITKLIKAQLHSCSMIKDSNHTTIKNSRMKVFSRTASFYQRLSVFYDMFTSILNT